ncbi:P-loop containing nucleoside triphosphate hydrolase [Kalmanozyma brasiliensis GHG001]|uniref:DNA helicase n=1 Tax=Kalmanozyma brasiliensis (strain GHG001) TaxID=1365824 RepID=V5GJY8_KALBG|nr:P-loop containing nucleoside triphosphate hydrolase [Kalmanozyma brasiliensis GHG001]EST06277.1 P-loop containing nucleoside triphosphate hydrolase [Kalmanozyma brasiliensis GHG001]
MSPTPLRQPEPPSQELLQRWFQTQSRLLADERTEEQSQSKLLLSKTAPKILEKHGLALLGLCVASIRIGVGAKLLVELERPSAHHASPNFPPHSFRSGDLAAILDNSADPSATNEGGLVQGVVFRTSETRIVLAISDGKGKSREKAEGQDKRDARTGENAKVSGGELELPERIRLVKVANETTFDRMELTLAKLAKSLGVPLTASSTAKGDTSDEDETPQTSASTTATSLTRSLFGLTPPAWRNIDLPLPPFNPKLNDTQLSAIQRALSANHFSLIHGPPGTGKTTAIVELIMQIVASNLGAVDSNPVRVLVCGASNLAVDNILERLVGAPEHREVFKKKSVGVTRLGHPARVVASLQGATLDAQCAQSSEAQLVKDISREIEDIMSELKPPPPGGNRSTKGKPKIRGSDRRKRWEEVRELRKEYRRRDRQVQRSVLDRAQIVLTTCHGAGGRQLAGREFDWVVIDEACQALEVACWIAVLKAREGGRLVLAGDHLQLPPTVKSTVSAPRGKGKGKGRSKSNGAGKHGDKAGKDAAQTTSQADTTTDDVVGDAKTDDTDDDADETDLASKFSTATLSTAPRTRLRPPRSLETTLFSRQLGLYGPGIKSLLSIQYRMSTPIMSFPNAELYESQLVAHTSCASIRLSDLASVSRHLSSPPTEDEEELLAPVVLYDTSGCEFYETTPSAEEGALLADSKSNVHEADLVVRHLEELFSKGVAPGQVTILTPYSAQVALLHATVRSHRFTIPAASGKGEEVVNADEIELGTIDSMQGREKDVVIISLVRSNAEGEVGFLAQKKRLNVAMTRAKRQLVVIGDAETVGNAKDLPDDFLKNYMDWLDENAVVHPVVATL